MILMLDDDEDDRLLVKNALVELGFRGGSRFVHDGDELLSYLHQSKNDGPAHGGCPNLILMDLSLPGTDGIQILREVQSYPEFQDIPIVVYTASEDARKKEQCLANGAVRWVTKSPTIEEITENIKSVLSAYYYTK